MNIIYDYSRTAGIHYKPDGTILIVHHPRPPFQQPEARIEQWWRITDWHTFNPFTFLEEHHLQIMMTKHYPDERPSGMLPLTSEATKQCTSQNSNAHSATPHKTT